MKFHSFDKLYFLFSLCFFLIFIPTGNLPSDTEYSVASAVSICEGKLSIAPNAQLPHLKEGRNGRYYSKYGIGYAVLFIPAALATKLCTQFLPINEKHFLYFFAGLTNTLIAALIIVLLARLFLKLGYSRKITFISIISIAAGSILLPYSKINHSEIPTVALLLLFLLRFAFSDKLTLRNGLMFGFLGSALLLLRIGNIVYSVSIFSCGVFLLIKGKFTISGLASILLPPVVTILFIIALNIFRFGNLSDTGYGSEQYLFTTPLLAGLGGLLLSPSKSAFLFSPLIILCLWSILSAVRRFRKLTIAILIMSIGNLIFYAKWHDWHGGWSWGPRLIVPSIILFHIFLPEFILKMKSSFTKQVVFTLVLPLAITINILGSMVWYQQIHYFFRHDYFSVANSQPVIAAKLFTNKLKGAPETYNCSDFHQDCKGDFYSSVYGNLVINQNTIDFKDFETFQGFSILWSCLNRNFGLSFLWAVPLVLLSFVLAMGYNLWKTASLKMKLHQ